MLFHILRLASQFYKYAESLSDVIEKMNLTQDFKDFLDSLEEEKKQYYVAALRKNPNISLDELKNITIKTKEKDNFFPFELKFINSVSAGMREWAAIWIKKLRKGKELSNKQVGLLELASNVTTLNTVEEIQAALNRVNITEKLVPYIFFLKKLNEISDWYDSEKPQIASYNPEQAIKESDAWHEMIAQHGKSLKYEEGPKNIVYQFANGWTIRKVTTENDLAVEGHLMNHCVGSYYHDVQAGTSSIYSLRDPANKPHATLEARGEHSYDFDQIMGHSNSDPKPEYKAMIGEWFQSLIAKGKKVTASSSIWEDLDNWDSGDNWHRLKRHIQDLKSDVNEYGLKSNFIENNSAKMFFNKFKSLAAQEPYETAEELAEILHIKDKKLYEELKEFETIHHDELNKSYPDINIKTYFDKLSHSWIANSGIYETLKRFDESQNKFNSWWMTIDDSNDLVVFPDPRDYEDGENDEEYLSDLAKAEKTKEMLDDENVKEMRSHFPFNFEDALHEQLKKYQAIDPIPSEKWMGEYTWDKL